MDRYTLAIIFLIAGILTAILGFGNDNNIVGILGVITTIGSMLLVWYEQFTSGNDDERLQAMIPVGFLVLLILGILFGIIFN